MKKIFSHWVWILLVALSLGLGGGAFRLLQLESQRIRAISDQLLAGKEVAILESFSIVLSETESGLMDSLASFPSENLEFRLQRWSEENPFVDGVFLREENTLLFSVGLDPDHSLEWEQKLLTRGDPEPEQPKASLGPSGGAELELLGFSSGANLDMDEEAPADTGSGSRESKREAVPPQATTSNLAETRARVRQVTKEAYFEQRALEEQIRQEEYRAQQEVSVNFNEAETTALGDSASPQSAPPPAEDGYERYGSPSEIASSELTSNPDFATPRPEAGQRQAQSEPAPSLPSPVTALPPDRRAGASITDWSWKQIGEQFQLVGQFQGFSGAPIRGVVVSRDALFEALTESLPEGGTRLMLSTPQRRSVANGGDPGIFRRLPETLFPGAILYLPRESGDVFNRSFWVIAGILIIILSASFFFGGTFLVYQGRRASLEASQKTDFLSNISHELKTPLTTIRMYAELLEEGRVSDVSKQRRYFHTIGAETQRLARLVNNILQFSALQKGKSRLRLQSLDLTELCRAVCENQAIRFEESNMRLLLSLPEEKIEVEADPDAVEQALINLFDNALKYAAEGEAVSCRLVRDSGVARITVEDFGPGIPRDQRRKIFEAFHRVDDSLTSSKPGSGLGLSITESLFRQMNGDLTYEPNEPKGSRFHLELPLL